MLKIALGRNSPRLELKVIVGDRKEVHRDQGLAVVGQKGRPLLARAIRTGRAPRHVTRNAAFGNVETQLHQFTVNSGGSPRWILFREAFDGAGSIGVDLTTSDSASPASKTPVEAKACFVPAGDGLRFDDDQRVAPTSPESAQRHPEEAIASCEAWPRTAALEDTPAGAA